MTCFFYGKYAKRQADNFEEGLKETGYGELIHPLYGIHKVVPTGSISRSDDVVSGINVSSVAVTFSETIIDSSVLSSEIVSIDSINLAVDRFEKKSVWQFVKDFTVARVHDAIWLGKMFKKGMKIVSDAIEKIAKIEKSIYTKWDEIQSELYDSIDEFVAAVDDVAIQTIKLIRLPANTSINAGAKIEGYSSAARDIIRNFKNDPVNYNNAKNQWNVTRLMLESLVVACASGVAVSVSSGTGSKASGSKSSNSSVQGLKNNVAFNSREEAVKAATAIAELYDDVIEFEEQRVGEDYFVETGESYAAMYDVVSLSIQQIIDFSFSLPTRKSFILGEDRQIIELVYELYGSLNKLDEFIIDNKLSYNEIEIIPMGREVAYYV